MCGRPLSVGTREPHHPFLERLPERIGEEQHTRVRRDLARLQTREPPPMSASVVRRAERRRTRLPGGKRTAAAEVGRMPRQSRANIVLPVPGGPTMSRWWPPAPPDGRAAARLGGSPNPTVGLRPGVLAAQTADQLARACHPRLHLVSPPTSCASTPQDRGTTATGGVQTLRPAVGAPGTNQGSHRVPSSSPPALCRHVVRDAAESRQGTRSPSRDRSWRRVFGRLRVDRVSPRLPRQPARKHAGTHAVSVRDARCRATPAT